MIDTELIHIHLSVTFIPINRCPDCIFNIPLRFPIQKCGSFGTEKGFIAQWACVGGPYADFTINPSLTDTCSGDYSFVDLSYQPLSWNWDFGDGVQDIVQNPSHSYGAYLDLTFKVRLTITNAFGTDYEEKTYPWYALDAGFRSDYDIIYLVSPYNGKIQFFDTTEYYVNSRQWDFGDGNTSTAANPTNQYDSVGTYSVVLTVSNGVCTEEVIKIIYVNLFPGIDEASENSDFVAVYPNPSEGLINIWIAGSKPQDLEVGVFNILGREVYSRRYNRVLNKLEPLDLTDLEKGIYFIKLSNKKHQITKKIILQ